MNYSPLFITGTARSGSTLLARMLAAHPEIMVACDPYFPLMRSLRNAIARSDSGFDASSPFQDYYFTEQRIRVLDLIQNGCLDVQFDAGEWQNLYASLVARAAAESSDLIPSLGGLKGETYRRLFDNALNLVAKVRRSESRRWIGFKEVWTIELFKALARAYPAARFVVIVRDPRAVLWSMLALARTDPTQFAHTLSYARHWRKYSAFITAYQADPLFADRLLVVRYEDLVRRPEPEADRLCRFLDVPFSSVMLDTSRYIDYRTMTAWEGNSSFGRTGDSDAARSWRQGLKEELIKLVDLACGPDMSLSGYEPVDDTPAAWSDSSVLRYLEEQNHLPCSWRTDLGAAELDYSAELSRRALLSNSSIPDDEPAIRCNFLFKEQFSKLQLQCKPDRPTSISSR